MKSVGYIIYVFAAYLSLYGAFRNNQAVKWLLKLLKLDRVRPKLHETAAYAANLFQTAAGKKINQHF